MNEEKEEQAEEPAEYEPIWIDEHPICGLLLED